MDPDIPSNVSLYKNSYS